MPSQPFARKHYEEVVLAYAGSECLVWPYSRDTKGYGRLEVDGKRRLVSRLVCAEKHGEPPTPEHEAAHTCGNGHLGCVARNHLVWKTRVQNRADMHIHGTSIRGERNIKAKITEADVAVIRALKGVVPQYKIGEMYGVRQSTISRIHRGSGWTHVAP